VAYRDTLRAALPFILGALACTITLRLLSRNLDLLAAPLFYTVAGAILSYAIIVTCLMLTRSGREFLGEAWSMGREYVASFARKLRGTNTAEFSS
jgi:hypothetical protein